MRISDVPATLIKALLIIFMFSINILILDKNASEELSAMEMFSRRNKYKKWRIVFISPIIVVSAW